MYGNYSNFGGQDASQNQWGQQSQQQSWNPPRAGGFGIAAQQGSFGYGANGSFDQTPYTPQNHVAAVSEAAQADIPMHESMIAGGGSQEAEVYRREKSIKILSRKDLCPAPVQAFEDLAQYGVPEYLFRAFLQKQMGFSAPSPIQSQTWPVALSGRDMIGIAETGSGKTLSFLLPAAVRIACHEQRLNRGETGPICLVLAPTRELAQQIETCAQDLSRATNGAVRSTCLVGGVSKGPQARDLRSGKEIVIATPGRLLDLLQDNRVGFSLNRVSYLCLDEADRMLDMGFEPQIKEIVGYLPAEKQLALFTATWPREVKQTAEAMTRSPTHIQVGSSDSITSNSDITQNVIKIHNEGDKMRFLENTIFPALQKTGASALIFTKTKKGASSLHYSLSKAGAPIVCLQGDMEQRERDYALFAFKSGKAKVLVATDVAQRGLDIRNVQCVINYDPANNMEDYVHRIGRTGRAGEKGEAYTFLYESERTQAQQIMTVMRKAGQAIPQDLKEIADMGGANLAAGWGNWKGSGGGGGGGWSGR